MYRRPILCTLYGAVDFLKVLKIAVVGGGEVLLMAGKKYWDVMYTLHPSTSSMIELHRPGINPGRPRGRRALDLKSYLDRLYCQ